MKISSVLVADDNKIPLDRYRIGRSEGYNTIEYVQDDNTTKLLTYIDSSYTFDDIFTEIAKHHHNQIKYGWFFNGR